MFPIKIPGSPQKCPAMMATVRLMITSGSMQSRQTATAAWSKIVAE